MNSYSTYTGSTSQARVYTGSNNQGRIYTSRAIEPTVNGRREFRMAYGDRMSIRVIVSGKTAAVYETVEVSDMTDLTGDMRRRLCNTKGLATVYIRNHDRGWSRERKVMLYGQRKYVAPTSRMQVMQTPMFYPWEL